MNCPKCHETLEDMDHFCPHCGAFFSQDAVMESTTPPTHSLDTLPPGIKKWNWGAFSFNIVWGIGNHSYLPLLCFIPLFNFIWMFVCGIKGNEWAFKSGKFNNVEDFIATQETWNRAGFAFFIMNVVLIFIYIILGLTLIPAFFYLR